MNFVESVEIVWIVLLAGVFLLAVLSGFVFQELRQLRLTDRKSDWRLFLRGLHHNQRGAAYSLSFVMVLPFLVVILGMIVETSNLLIAKAGTMHAAFNAVRAASVWTTVNSENEAFSQIEESNLAVRKAERAAVIAMTPYAGGLRKDQTRDSEADVFLAAYDDYVATDRPQKPIRSSYIRNKHSYARQNTRLNLVFSEDHAPEPWRNEITAEIAYDAPFLLPFIGRLLGGRSKNGRVVYEIRSDATQLNECPKNPSGHLGIRGVPGL